MPSNHLKSLKCHHSDEVIIIDRYAHAAQTMMSTPYNPSTLEKQTTSFGPPEPVTSQQLHQNVLPEQYPREANRLISFNFDCTMPPNTISIREVDETGSLKATYIITSPTSSTEKRNVRSVTVAVCCLSFFLVLFTLPSPRARYTGCCPL